VSATRARHTGLAVGLGGVALAGQVQRWWPYLSDDALISLRYAQRLLDGHGLTWTDGPAVEGYSNLLFVLLTAALGALGVDLIDAARVVGIGATAAWMGAAAWLGARGGLAGAVGAVAVLAASGIVGIWALGGLEQPLLCALVAIALACWVDERPRLAAAALALCALTRPDAPLLVALVCGGAWLADGQDRRALVRAVVLGLPALGATAGQLVFRVFTYGDVVPNTAHAKLPAGTERLDGGALYVWEGLSTHGPTLAAAAVALVYGGPLVRLALPLLGGWLAYVVWIGGDIFPGYRHLAPTLVPLSMLVGVAAAGLAKTRGRTLAVLGLLAAGGGAQWADQQEAPHFVRAELETWVWDGQVIGELLGQAFPGSLVAVSAAGCVPYWSGLPSLDMLGLNDRWIATHPPADRGRGWLGHDLGDGAYVLEQAPDLLLFCGPRGSEKACHRSERELLALPDFRAAHRLVAIRGEQPHGVDAVVWIRLDGRAGLAPDAGAVGVPGWLLDGQGAAVWRGGRLVRPVGQGGLRLQLPPELSEASVRGIDGDPGLAATVAAGTLTVSGVGELRRVTLTR